MPIYTYRCKQCGEFDITKGINDDELKNCPKCNEQVERVFKSNKVIWKCEGSYSKVNSK